MHCLNSVTFLPILYHVGTWQFSINDAVTYILILDNDYVCATTGWAIRHYKPIYRHTTEPKKS